MNVASPSDLLTVPQVAAKYGVHRVSIWRWIAKGLIATVRVGPTQLIRIERCEADRHYKRTEGAKS